MCRDPLLISSDMSGMASESEVLSLGFGHQDCDPGCVMLEPVVGTMTSKLQHPGNSRDHFFHFGPLLGFSGSQPWSITLNHLILRYFLFSKVEF